MDHLNNRMNEAAEEQLEGIRASILEVVRKQKEGKFYSRSYESDLHGIILPTHNHLDLTPSILYRPCS